MAESGEQHDHGPRDTDEEGLAYLHEVPQARPHIHAPRIFPEGFLWGTATSAHQVEGGNRNNDWWLWEQEPGHIYDKTVSGEACDHYCRYEADFDLAAELGTNAHRISVEWARIEPRDGEWDMDEVLHYRQVLESLRKRGMKTMVTLWHFTLPEWFAAQGGWESPRAVAKFERYAAFVARELSDVVDFWITINEPVIYTGQSYGSGAWPPGVKNQLRLARVFLRLAKAHKAAYKALHAEADRTGREVPVGFSNNVVTFEPYRSYSVLDANFIRIADLMFNRLFMFLTRGHHDYIGINYYFHYRVKYVPSKMSQFFFEVHTENREVSDLGWEIHAPGIFEAIMSMNRYKLPIYITENGIASADDGKRPRALVGMVKEVYHAIQAGADVRGYFHWSLLDNFEWEKGLSGRFGLIAVDYSNQKRTPRRSYFVYQDICRKNGVEHELLKFMGHGVRW
jgi:beta-glucosidase